jgi:hypothetical protein
VDTNLVRTPKEQFFDGPANGDMDVSREREICREAHVAVLLSHPSGARNLGVLPGGLGYALGTVVHHH